MSHDTAQTVTCARGWLGTRFAHQGRRKKSAHDAGGVDCLGLLVGVAQECNLMLDGVPLSRFDECDYGHFPDEKRLYDALMQCLDPVALCDTRPGDVLLLRVDDRTQHLGIVADYAGGGLSLIHAYAPARAVVEHRLDEHWRGQVVVVFRWRG